MRCAIRNFVLRNLFEKYHTLIEEKYTDIAPRYENALIMLESSERMIEWISMLNEDLNARIIRDT